jgi:hypothetical protein
LAASSGAFGVLILAIYVFGRGHLPPDQAALRARSFIWPAVQCGIGLVVAAGLVWAGRRVGRAGHVRRQRVGAGWWAAAAFLVGETVFLVASGGPLQSSSPHNLAPTAAEVALRDAVGNSLVGLGESTCFTVDQLGTVPEANDAFGIREFALYDPLLPRDYYTAWLAQTAQQPLARPDNAIVPFSVFCPAVTSARQARRYGIGFVLEHFGAPVPTGFVPVKAVGFEELYRVPGAADATVVPAARGGPLPDIDAPGRPVAVTHPDPATWRLVTRSPGPAVVRLRLTDVSGWHATVDGNGVALQRYAGVMLQARVPAGRHVVELHYRPTAFVAGIAVAGAGVVGLVAVPLGVRLRRKARPGSLNDRA